MGPRAIGALLVALALLAAPAAAADYERHFIGDRALPTPGRTAPGLLLMGGGDRNLDALRWFLAKAGNGHVVVLRASLGGEIGVELHDEVGGAASVETFVVASREASSDRRLLAALRAADGIFIAGGDQSRYIRYWKGTPVEAALEAHVRAGKPLGGTSAGLAILGEFVYGAMDGGSQTGPRALADPLGPENTIETGFLDLPLLRGVLTDTHFRERNRLGRLLAFVAKAETLSGGRPVLGLGVDEDAALAVEADGRTRVYATAPGAGATVVRGGFAQAQEEDRPMQLDRIETVGVGIDSVLHLPSGEVEKPMWTRRHAVRDGVLLAQDAPRLVIHGGAGVEPGDLTPEEEAAARAALAAALRAGHAELAAGRPALDAVTAAVVVLEDAPMFNAGRGAVFTHDGRNELDTSIMDGASGRAGAAAGLHRVRNPIRLARAIMERSRHVMMVGEGAERFAKDEGIALVDPSYFRTEKRWQQLQKALRDDSRPHALLSDAPPRAYFGTVGAVALDAQGLLAAGTSTGGMTNKRYGRVGDAPIIGAGTWADDRCAVSGTGWGEFYIRTAAAHEICARVRLSGDSIARAGEAVINDLIPAAGGDGGAIVLGADGNASFPFNTGGMYRGWIGEDGVPHVAIWPHEGLTTP